MKLIVPHRNPDFDAFASAVAAKLLYPDHEIVVSGQPNQNLQEYLGIYGDQFVFMKENELPDKKVEAAIIVDTASPNRVGKKTLELLKDAPKILVYDHHPDLKEGGFEGELHIENLGATVTMFVEMLEDKNIEIKPIEATLFMIAIYEDTGSLLYSSTTPRDFAAAKFLLEKGANLVEVSEYVRFDLSYDQKQILDILMNNIHEYTVDGLSIVIATAQYPKFVGGLNIVTSKLWSGGGYETLICIVKMGKKTFIIGRTTSTDVDIGGLMKSFGGGGHRKAGSAALSDTSVEETVRLVLGKLKKYITPAFKARDVMSSPVKVILAHQKIEEANRIMERTGHNGLPVVEGNRLVGIVTKKAVDKAMNHDLDDRPVKSIMTPKLITATPDTPLSQIRQMMIENSVGRIPILENGVLVGIVTRTDVLRAIFGEVSGKKKVETVKFIMGKVTEYLLNLITKQVKDNGIVVWCDPEKA